MTNRDTPLFVKTHDVLLWLVRRMQSVLKKLVMAWFLSAASTLCLFIGSATADEPAGKRYAVLIGVNDYAELKDLEYCCPDIMALRERLVAAGFSERRIYALHDQAEDAKYRPSKANIDVTLKLVAGLAEKEDVVLVAFSGHGVHLDGTTYLCPYEGQFDSPSTLVSLAQVYAQLKDCPATFKLVLVDACRDDPRLGSKKSTSGVATKPFTESLVKSTPEGIILLTSCSPGEASREDEELGRGVFMNFVLEGLGGKADEDESGSVSLRELADYAAEETTTFVAQKYRAVQKPRLLGDFDPQAPKRFVVAARLERPEMNLPVTPSRPVPAPMPRDPDTKDTITNSIGMKLRLIPAGEFLMGSTDAEEGHVDNEALHRVKITRPYYMGVYEVTQAEYEQVMDENPSYFSHGGDGRGEVHGKSTDRFPVEQVSWKDAVLFCAKLTEQEGRRYRLPTEAEWEYACRAGTTLAYSKGPSLNSNQANIQKNVGCTTDVGSYHSNAFGLYDMHGNVAEWCHDWYGANHYGTSPRDDPWGPETGEARMIRGGGWGSNPVYCRSAYRRYVLPSHRNGYIGFRVVREP